MPAIIEKFADISKQKPKHNARPSVC